MGLSVSREAEHWGPRAEIPSLHPLDTGGHRESPHPHIVVEHLEPNPLLLPPPTFFIWDSLNVSGSQLSLRSNELFGFHQKLLVHSEDFIFFFLSSWQQNFLSKHRILHFPCRMCLFIRPPPPQVEPWKSWWSQHGSHCQTQNLHRGKVWVLETGASTSFHPPGAGQSSSLSPHHPGLSRPTEGPYPSS